jgi:hypothetical protein
MIKELHDKVMKHSDDTQYIPTSARLETVSALTLKDGTYLFYIRTQYVPRCKHSPLRL